MNYHPLLVHFPIAFMTIYSLLELIRFKKILKLDYWFYLKAVLVIVGAGAALPTILTGKIIEGLFESPILEVHSSFAYASTLVFGLIAISYLVSWIDKDFYSFVKNNGAWRYVSITNNKFIRINGIVILALLGLILISITGALGGIVAFGPGVDPITQMINGVFFGK